jgi:hypothetical protein
VGLYNINLIDYFELFITNSTNIIYIKKYYENILYFYIINYYIKQNISSIDNINLVELYKVFKLQSPEIIDKTIMGIKESEIIKKLRNVIIPFISLTKRGGAVDSKIKEDKEETEDKNKLNKVNLIENSSFSYFIHIDLDLYPGDLSKTENKNIPLIKSLYLSCNNTKENIKKNIADIRHTPYKQSSYSSKELLSMDPSFPVEKFFPNYIEETDKKSEKQKMKDEKKKRKEEEKEQQRIKEEEEEEEKRRKKEEKKRRKELKKGGEIDQIPNPHTIYPSFLNEYLN